MKNFYEKVLKWLNDVLSPKVSKFTQNPYVMAVQSAFQLILPMILVGSIANLVGTFRNFIHSIPDISIINQYSFGLIGLFMAFVIPYNIMELKQQNRAKIIAGFTGISVMLILTKPVIANGNITTNVGYLGTSGMTVGLIVGLLLGWIFSVYFKHGLFPKDTSLPSIVVVWFESIIPIIAMIAIAVCIKNTGVDLFALVEKGMEPIKTIAESYFGFVILYFSMCLFYSLGLSAWAVYPIFFALAIPNIAANAALVAKGLGPIYINTIEVVFCGWCTFGGAGCTMPLNIQMIRSKSKRISSIGKVSIVPSIFNINEPVMYGLPVVWNPLMMIPYLLVSFIIPSLTYFVLKGGLVAIPARSFAMNYLPQPIATFLTNYDFKGVIFWIILFIIAYMIYLPFFKVYEKQEIRKEKAETAEG
ncbi:MAG TPA: PTS sugar transporter subunit IIC [Clostridiaceae bacterium]|nr:PTS sugar transporter subunit IIC [Clostridiaceae bacterium]